MRIGSIRLLVGLLLAVCTVTPVLAEQPAPVSLWFPADITIAADGSITELSWQNTEKIPAKLQERLARAVHSWQFMPGSVDGVPAKTQTTLTLHLQASDLGAGKLGLALVGAYTGPFSNHRVPPDYPRDALRRGVNAKIRVMVSIDEHGEYNAKVVDFKSSHKGDRWRESFAESALAAVAEWGVRQERVAGHPVPAQMSIPITYCVDSERWCSENMLSSPDTAVGAAPPGAPVALGSVATLLTDIRKTKI